MKWRLSLLAGAVLLGCLTFGLRGACAQAKPAAPRIEERQFLLYALEVLGRRPLGDAVREDNRCEPQHMYLSRFAAQQRLVLDTLRRHSQKRKYEDLLPLFESYEKYLNGIDELGKILDRLWVERVRQKAAADAASGARILFAALDRGLASAAAGEDDQTAIARGLKGMVDTAASEAVKRKWMDAAAGKAMAADMQKAYEQALPELEKTHADFKKQFQEHAEANRTEDAEYFFQGKTEVAHNPFMLGQKATALGARKGVSVKEQLEQAEVLRGIANRVPTDRTFNAYRAGFLGCAGVLANRAATRDIGATGFPLRPRDVSSAAKQAYRIWNAYVRVEPFQTAYSPRVVHEFILACAQSGNAPIAHNLILKAIVLPQRGFRPLLNTSFSTQPQLWYDCARVCSRMGNTGLAMGCLQQAVKLGFRDLEAAKVSPDLENVRGHQSTAPSFTKLFP